MTKTEWSASGVHSLNEALHLASGFTSVHGVRYAVLHYADVGEYDVEPAHFDDEVGQFGVLAITVPQ